MPFETKEDTRKMAQIGERFKEWRAESAARKERKVRSREKVAVESASRTWSMKKEGRLPLFSPKKKGKVVAARGGHGRLAQSQSEASLARPRGASVQVPESKSDPLPPLLAADAAPTRRTKKKASSKRVVIHDAKVSEAVTRGILAAKERMEGVREKKEDRAKLPYLRKKATTKHLEQQQQQQQPRDIEDGALQPLGTSRSPKKLGSSSLSPKGAKKTVKAAAGLERSSHQNEGQAAASSPPLGVASSSPSSSGKAGLWKRWSQSSVEGSLAGREGGGAARSEGGNDAELARKRSSSLGRPPQRKATQLRSWRQTALNSAPQLCTPKTKETAHRVHLWCVTVHVAARFAVVLAAVEARRRQAAVLVKGLIRGVAPGNKSLVVGGGSRKSGQTAARFTVAAVTLVTNMRLLIRRRCAARLRRFLTRVGAAGPIMATPVEIRIVTRLREISAMVRCAQRRLRASKQAELARVELLRRVWHSVEREHATALKKYAAKVKRHRAGGRSSEQHAHAVEKDTWVDVGKRELKHRHRQLHELELHLIDLGVVQVAPRNTVDPRPSNHFRGGDGDDDDDEASRATFDEPAGEAAASQQLASLSPKRRRPKGALVETHRDRVLVNYLKRRVKRHLDECRLEYLRRKEQRGAYNLLDARELIKSESDEAMLLKVAKRAKSHRNNVHDDLFAHRPRLRLLRPRCRADCLALIKRALFEKTALFRLASRLKRVRKFVGFRHWRHQAAEAETFRRDHGPKRLRRFSSHQTGLHHSHQTTHLHAGHHHHAGDKHHHRHKSVVADSLANPTMPGADALLQAASVVLRV